MRRARAARRGAKKRSPPSLITTTKQTKEIKREGKREPQATQPLTSLFFYYLFSVKFVVMAPCHFCFSVLLPLFTPTPTRQFPPPVSYPTLLTQTLLPPALATLDHIALDITLMIAARSSFLNLFVYFQARAHKR